MWHLLIDNNAQGLMGYPTDPPRVWFIRYTILNTARQDMLTNLRERTRDENWIWRNQQSKISLYRRNSRFNMMTICVAVRVSKIRKFQFFQDRGRRGGRHLSTFPLFLFEWDGTPLRIELGWRAIWNLSNSSKKLCRFDRSHDPIGNL